MDPINWTRTGGMIGRTRRWPGYVIERAPNGCLVARDETTKLWRAAGVATAEDMDAILRPFIKAMVMPTDPGPDGKPQLVIPGCEHAPSATVAARRADEPMRPKAGQVHTMPERGLWGDHGQGELFG